MAEYDTRIEAEIALDFPVTFQGATVDKLTMRRPKTKDGIAAARFKGTDAERGMFLMARLCNVDPGLLAEVDEVDSVKLNKQYNDFTGRRAED